MLKELFKPYIFQAVLGMDILCQAKSGMGKTAVFVLATLQQLEPVDGQVIGVEGGAKFSRYPFLHFFAILMLQRKDGCKYDIHLRGSLICIQKLS